MTEYIDREALLKAIEDFYWTGKKTLRQTIRDIPAADVRERMRCADGNQGWEGTVGAGTSASADAPAGTYDTGTGGIHAAALEVNLDSLVTVTVSVVHVTGRQRPHGSSDGRTKRKVHL